MAKSGLHCFVAGQVQGVFYRTNTQRKAVELGLTGWVRNLDDGRVEVMAWGETEQLALLKAWLGQGPSAAKVSTVESQQIPVQEFIDFVVK
jgi:acylphosphatase